jgi:hypothetical protein
MKDYYRPYHGCEIASKLTGFVIALRNKMQKEGDIKTAIYLNKFLIEIYQDGGWSDHNLKWLDEFNQWYITAKPIKNEQ